jgi:hypothetical protein
LIFTACVACKNQFQNLFMQAKNPVCRTGFLQLDFSKIKYRSTGGEALNFDFIKYPSVLNHTSLADQIGPNCATLAIVEQAVAQ